jgi:hypothetical protein
MVTQHKQREKKIDSNNKNVNSLKDKEILSLKNANGNIRLIKQNVDVIPNDYLQFGRGWFTLPNFYNGISITFKVSKLKRKNDFGIPMIAFDFVCLLEKGQKSINDHPEDFNKLMAKLTSVALKMVKEISLDEKKDYSFLVRQAAPWLLSLEEK